MPGLIVGECDAPDEWKDLLFSGGRERFGVGEGFEERGGDKVYSLVGALGREDNSQQKMKGRVIVQLGSRLGDVILKPLEHILVSFLRSHAGRQRFAASNSERKRTSFSENIRRSLTRYLRFVIRSIPIPNAYPVYSLESMPQASRTLGSTIPHPRISTHPVPLQKAQPLPPQMLQEMSISADGSVKGK